MSSASNVPPVSSWSFSKYAKISVWPRWSPEMRLDPGMCQTASVAIRFFSAAASFDSKAAYSCSTTA